MTGLSGPAGDRRAQPESRAVQRRRAGAFLIAAAIIGGLLGFGRVPARADAAGDAARFLADTNRERAAAGAAPLAANQALAGVAQRWSDQMSASGHLAHNPNLVSDIDRSVTTDWRTYGENVGTGPDVESVQAAFVNSPEHHQNMVNPAFTEVGIAVSYASNGALWVTLDFLQPNPPRQVAAAAGAPQAPAAARPLPVPVAAAPQAVPATGPATTAPPAAARAAAVPAAASAATTVLAEVVTPMKIAELAAAVDLPGPLRRPFHRIPAVLEIGDALLIAGVIGIATRLRLA